MGCLPLKASIAGLLFRQRHIPRCPLLQEMEDFCGNIDHLQVHVSTLLHFLVAWVFFLRRHPFDKLRAIARQGGQTGKMSATEMSAREGKARVAKAAISA